MGECGCMSCGQHFKLKAPDGWYVVQLLPGCDYCGVGPGLQIYHPEATRYIDDIEYMPDLPVIGEGEHRIAMIKCGLDPDEARDAAAKCFVGSEVEDSRVDTVLAEILGEDFWKDALSKPPSMIYPLNKKE